MPLKFFVKTSPSNKNDVHLNDRKPKRIVPSRAFFF